MANITWKDSAQLLVEHKAQLKDYANAKRRAIERAGFSFGGNRFDSDQDSFNRLIATLALVNSGRALPAGFAWRTADDKDIAVTDADMKNMLVAFFTHAHAAHKTLNQVKAAIKAGTLTTTAAIDAASWPT